MKKQLFIYMTMAALALAACSQDDTAPTAERQIPIRLNSSVENGMTRAYSATNLPNNRKVYVWSDMINLSDSRRINYFNCWSLTAKGDGTLESTDVKFFPATNTLDLYAMTGTFSGYVFDSENLLPTTQGIYHTVSANQKTEGAYYASDLLYAQVRGQVPVEDAVTLPMYHMLSKVRVLLFPGNGDTTNDRYTVEQLRTATVKLLGVETRVKLTPSADGFTNAQFAEQANRATMVEVAPKTADDDEEYVSKHDIEMQTVAAVPNEEGEILSSSYGEAIIVPQVIPAGKFIEVSFADAGTGLTRQTYFRFDDDFTFESGKQYQFQLTVHRVGQTYTIRPQIVTADDWKDEAANRPADFTGTWNDDGNHRGYNE